MFVPFILLSFLLQILATTVNLTSSNVGEVKVHTVGDLEDLAVVKGYGYKYANLSILEGICEGLKGAPFSFRVPEFTGISSEQVHSLLSDFDLTRKWQAVVDAHYLSEESREEAFKTKSFSDAFLRAVEPFKAQLSNALEDKRLQENCIKTHILGFLSDKIYKRLMVRSTGKEDSDKLSNAGGNESVPNVFPTYDAVFDAIKAVVISYYDVKSLSQRLRARDPDLFKAEQITPVIIQVMAGARYSWQVSKCGVMFTGDPQISTEDSKATTGITIIQSAYGHNEAVVLGMIPVDTYYIGKDRSITPIIRNKSHRYVPTRETGLLNMIANSKRLAKSPSLDREAVDSMKILSDELERVYGRSMDVEFVVTEEDKAIHIVQARPIIRTEGKERPSYLDEGRLAGHMVHRGSTILFAGSAVRTCSRQNSIVANRISEAYRELFASKVNIECIILGQMAPSTSHEATTFRGDNIVMVYFKNYEEIQDIINESDVLLSPQQGLIMPLKDARMADLIREGWYSFPAPQLMSLYKQFLMYDDYDPNIDDFIKHHPETSKRLLAMPMDELLSVVKDRSSSDQVSACRVMEHVISMAIFQRFRELPVDYSRVESTKLLLRAISNAFRMVSSDSVQDEANQLLHYHQLRTLIYQQFDVDVIYGSSVLQLIGREMIPEISLRDRLKDNDINRDETYELLKVLKAAHTPEVKANYELFILDLDKNYAEFPELYHEYMRIIGDFVDLDIVSLWLHVCFSQPHKRLSEPKESIEKDQTFIKFMIQKMAQVKALVPSSFAKEKAFEKHLDSLNEQFIKKFTESEFLEGYEAMGTIAKIVTIKVFSELVDKIDLSIKELKVSLEIPESQRLEREQKFLRLFFSLLKNWVTLSKWRDPGVEYNSFVSIKRQLKKIKLTSNDLKFSPAFNVSSAVLTCKSYEDSSYGIKTLEDAYSLIHQDLQTQLSILVKESGVQMIAMPELMRKVESELQMTNNLLGISLEMNGITKFYNEALRGHGIQKTLVYNRHFPGQIRITSWYAGANDQDRWGKMQMALIVLKYTSDEYKVENIEYNPSNGVGFDLVLTEATSLPNVADIFFEIFEYLMQSKWNNDLPILGIGLTLSFSLKDNSLIRMLREICKKCSPCLLLKNEQFIELLSKAISAIEQEELQRVSMPEIIAKVEANLQLKEDMSSKLNASMDKNLMQRTYHEVLQYGTIQKCLTFDNHHPHRVNIMFMFVRQDEGTLMDDLKMFIIIWKHTSGLNIENVFMSHQFGIKVILSEDSDFEKLKLFLDGVRRYLLPEQLERGGYEFGLSSAISSALNLPDNIVVDIVREIIERCTPSDNRMIPEFEQLLEKAIALDVRTIADASIVSLSSQVTNSYKVPLLIGQNYPQYIPCYLALVVENAMVFFENNLDVELIVEGIYRYYSDFSTEFNAEVLTEYYCSEIESTLYEYLKKIQVLLGKGSGHMLAYFESLLQNYCTIRAKISSAMGYQGTKYSLDDIHELLDSGISISTIEMFFSTDFDLLFGALNSPIDRSIALEVFKRSMIVYGRLRPYEYDFYKQFQNIYNSKDQNSLEDFDTIVKWIIHQNRIDFSRKFFITMNMDEIIERCMKDEYFKVVVVEWTKAKAEFAAEVIAGLRIVSSEADPEEIQTLIDLIEHC